MAGDDWSLDEVEAIVGDYFSMLRTELSDEDYAKTAHVSLRLRLSLVERSS